MKKSTPYLLVILAGLLLSLLPTKEAKASHAAGGELIYEWIDSNTYRFYFKFYRDCNGIAEPATQNMCAFNPCTSTTYNVPLNKLQNCPNCPGTGEPVSPGCAGFKTRCDSAGSLIPGYREWWYTATWEIPSRCNAWRFGVSISARNSSWNFAGQPLFYVETTFNNTFTYQGPSGGPQRGNSSPYFSVKPIPYTCINQPYTYNNGAVDPDGDSLMTEIMNPLNNSSCGVAPALIPLAQQGAPLLPALAIPGNPIQTGNTFNLTANTGQMSFTPLGPISVTAPAQPPRGHTLTVRTLEYRNGVQIGSIMRDIQVQVIPCTTTPSSVNVSTPTITGAVWNATSIPPQVEACVDQAFQFCYNATSIDPVAILKVEDNHTIIAPTSNTVYTNSLTNNVTGCFSWTPGFLDTGLRVLAVTVKDSTCKPPGILLSQTFTIPIFVWPHTRAIQDTSICPLDSVSVAAIGGGNFQWSVAPGGSPITSLSCINCTSPKVRPAVNTQYIVTSTINPQCKHIRDTVTIGVRPTPTIDAGPDTLTCIGSSLQMNVNVVQQPGLTYTVKWTPSVWLSSDTSFTPVATPRKDTTYYLTVTSSDANACKAYDTVKIIVLQGYNILNNDTAICEGQTVQVNFTGDTRYNFVWTPPSGVSDPNSSSPTITPTGPIDTIVYSVTASRPGCADSTREFTIEVQPNPTVTMTTPQPLLLCYGDTVTLDAIITPDFPYTYSWTPGSALNDPNIINALFTAYSTTTLNLEASTSAGCKNDGDVTITVNPAEFLVVSNDTAICPGDTVQLHLSIDPNAPTAIGSFSWSPATDNISDPVSTDPYVWPFTSTSYTVVAVDTNLCQDTQTVQILVRPQAMVSLPDSIRLYPGEHYQMSPTGNCLYFTWFPPLGLDDHRISNPKAKPDVNTRYIVQGVTEGGCVATDSIEVFVAPDSYINLPNAFTPGSNPNKLLKVVHNGMATLKNFTIYNRWGVKVFETSDISAGWDGMFNGEPQPMGVYIYTIEGKTSSGKTVNKQGNITLIR